MNRDTTISILMCLHSVGLELPLGEEVAPDHPTVHMRSKVRHCIIREIGSLPGIEFQAGREWWRRQFTPEHMLDLEPLVKRGARGTTGLDRACAPTPKDRGAHRSLRRCLLAQEATRTDLRAGAHAVHNSSAGKHRPAQPVKSSGPTATGTTESPAASTSALPAIR